ncbi:MAG: segregation/condensation protein A [Erysipelotrichales bacterium]|nr:segregation/condensation protein A [Erysipelotrichales bacterium]
MAITDEFKVTIDQFEGPLDLMLHLIKEKKLDLFNLDLDVLADQYIDYIRSMEKLHLDIAGEYLAEMAELIEYKSKKLLPRDTSELEDNYEEDTREVLIQRLLEYQQFKEVTGTFRELSEARSMQFDKPESDLANFYRKESELNSASNDGTMAELLKAMNQCLKRYRIMQPMPVSVAHREVSAEERIDTLKRRIPYFPEVFSLDDLCADCEDVYLVIVTFLAALDMIKNGELIAAVSEERILFRRGVNYGK